MLQRRQVMTVDALIAAAMTPEMTFPNERRRCRVQSG